MDLHTTVTIMKALVLVTTALSFYAFTKKLDCVRAMHVVGESF